MKKEKRDKIYNIQNLLKISYVNFAFYIVKIFFESMFTALPLVNSDANYLIINNF